MTPLFEDSDQLRAFAAHAAEADPETTQLVKLEIAACWHAAEKHLETRPPATCQEAGAMVGFLCGLAVSSRRAGMTEIAKVYLEIAGELARSHERLCSEHVI